jgi:hypothetical protein
MLVQIRIGYLCCEVFGGTVPSGEYAGNSGSSLKCCLDYCLMIVSVDISMSLGMENVAEAS